MKHIIKLFVILAVMACILPVRAVYGETLDDYLNNLVGPKQHYNTMVSPSYIKNNTTEEYIDPQSGELTLSQTDYSLPGRNGLNLEIKRLYKSGITYLWDQKVKYENGAWVDYQTDATTSTFYDERYNLGSGMRFSFPTIEIKKNSDGSSYRFLHSESGAVYRLCEPVIVNNKKTYYLENHPVKDVWIEEDTSYTNGQQGEVPSKYVMVDKNGTKTYFSDSDSQGRYEGRILGIKDRYNNEIKFEYSTVSYIIRGFLPQDITISKRLISKITDTLGRKINIEYKEGALDNGNNVYSARSNGEFKAIIYLPDGTDSTLDDNKKIIYNKLRIFVTSDGSYIIRTTLGEVWDVDGSIKYSFNYDNSNLGFTYTNGDNYTQYNMYFNLDRVDYKKKNLKTVYTYGTYKKKLSNDGSMQYRKVDEKKEIEKTGQRETVKNQIDYSYTNEPDGYGINGMTEFTDEFTVAMPSPSATPVPAGASGWITYGGTWKIENGEYSVEAGEGVKSVAEGTEFSDFTYDVDINISNESTYSSAGPIFRTRSTSSQGPDSLMGYTAVIDAQQDRVMLSRFIDNSCTIIQAVSMNISAGTTYHMKVVANGSNIKVYVTDMNTPKINLIDSTHTSGAVGLRTYRTHAHFDNVKVYDNNFRYSSEITDLKGAKIAYNYNAEHELISTVKYGAEHREVISVEYDLNKLPTKQADTSYDIVNGRLTGKSSTKYENYLYDVYGNLLQYTDADAERDANGEPLLTAGKTYNADGVTVNNHTVVYRYATDRYHKLTKKIWKKDMDTICQTLYPDIDSMGNVKQEKKVHFEETADKSVITDYEYDSYGNMTKKSVYSADAPARKYVTNYVYGVDADGADHRGAYLTKEYSSIDGTTEVSNKYVYDFYTGNKLSSIDANGSRTDYEYDVLGRLVTVKNPDRRSVDNFNNTSLNSAWNRIREDSAKWSLSENPGSMRITTQSGDIVNTSNNMKNILLQTSNPSDFTVTAKLTFNPSQNYQQAGLIVYVNDDNYITISRKYNDGKLFSMVKEINGSPNESTIPDTTGIDTVYLRIVKAGTQYSGYYSTDNIVWNQIGGTLNDVNLTSPRTGLFAANGVSAASGTAADFDWFDMASSTKKYEYHDYENADKEIWYKDPEDRWFLYRYDALGNLVNYSVKDDGGIWNTISEYEYDSGGNKTKEIDANGHSIRYEYDSAYRLVEKSFWEDDDKEKASVTLGYTVGYDSLTPLLVCMTDEEGNVTGNRYNIMNRLVDTESATHYSTQYTYDYMGNKTSETLPSLDGKDRTTVFAYDDLGRLERSTIKDYNTIYGYNCLDKVVIKEEPDGRITENVYDDLGRVVTKKLYKEGETEYIYESYTLDNVGNIKTLKQGKNISGSDILSLYNVYNYDSMNRLTDEYNQIDSDLQAGKRCHVNYQYDRDGNNTQRIEYINAGETGYIETIYGYDYAGNIKQEEGMVENNGQKGYYCKKYIRDYAGNIISEEEYEGGSMYAVTAYKYDYRNKMIEKTEPYGSDEDTKTTYFEYDKKGNLISKSIMVQGLICATSYEYDDADNIVRRIDPEENTIWYSYDANNNLIEEIEQGYSSENGATARRMKYEYDELNRQIKKIAYLNGGSIGTVIQYKEYDGRGNVVLQADGEGYNADNPSASIGDRNEYDAADRVVKFTSAETVKYNNANWTNLFSKKNSYDGSGRLISEEITHMDENNIDYTTYTTTYSYYMNGKLKEKVYPDGIKEMFDYDLTGKIETTSVKRGGSANNPEDTTNEYNTVFGKPYRIEYPDGTVETFDYTPVGQVRYSADRNGNAKYYTYDHCKNITSEKEYIKEDSDYKYYRLKEYTYDEANNLLTGETFEIMELKHGEGLEFGASMNDRVEYTYNRAGQLTVISGPNGRRTENEYYKNGLLKTKKERVSASPDYYAVKRYEYDILSQLIRETVLVESSDVYSSRSPVEGYIEDSEYPSRYKSTTSYIYYKNGNLKSKTDPYGHVVSYEYDFDGRKTKVSEEIGGNTESDICYSYDINGNLLSETNALDKTTTYEYDELGRVIRKIAPAPDTDGLTETTAVTRYLYDTAGNVEKIITPNYYDFYIDMLLQTDFMTGLSYTYDCMNRRISTISPEGSVIEYINYDNNGNVQKVTDGLRYMGYGSPGKVFHYDGLNRLIQETNAKGENTYYEYDVLGNKTEEINGRGIKTQYSYNPDGTLRRVTYFDQIDAEYAHEDYTYDKLGRKLSETDRNGNTTRYAYNALGKVKAITDPLEKTKTMRYDLNGNLTEEKDKRENVTLYDYYGDNRLEQKRVPIEPEGYYLLYAVQILEYDSAGNITKKTETGDENPWDSRVTDYTYYNNGMVDTVTDNGGRETKKYYDKNGNIIKEETLRDAGSCDISKYEYDNMDRMTKSIKLVDRSDIYDNDINVIIIGTGESLIDDETGKLMIITGYEYDLLGNKKRVISPRAYGSSDPDNYTTTYDYDILNRVESISRWHQENGNWWRAVYTQYWYDEAGNKIEVQDERGYMSEFTYDCMNRLETINDYAGGITEFGYDLEGNKTSMRNAENNTFTYEYDEMNRLEMVRDPYRDVVEKRIYDANGNLVELFDAKGYLSNWFGTRYEYDAANRLVKVTDPEAAEWGYCTVKYEYNQYGEKTKEITPPLNATFAGPFDSLEELETCYTYDKAGNLTKVTDAQLNETNYTYDKAGNKTSVENGRHATTTYQYGCFGILRAVITPEEEQNTTTYKYDLDMNIVDMKDRNGFDTIYTYDNMNNLLSKSVTADGTTYSVSYTYDEAGNRKSMTDATGTLTYEYDNNSRLERVEENGDDQLEYTYDHVGNVLTVTDKEGFVTSYEYDALSRMEYVSYVVNGFFKHIRYEYDENGNRQAVIYEENGVREEYTYDRCNRLLTLTNEKDIYTVLSYYTYTYDLGGRQLTKTDSYGTTTYTYDELGRIKQVQTPGKTTIYHYDAAGNRDTMDETYTSEQSGGFIDESTGNTINYIKKSSVYIYSASDRLMQLTETMKDADDNEVLVKTVGYVYDYNGNILSQDTGYTVPSDGSVQQDAGISAYGDETVRPIYGGIELENNEYDGFNRLIKTETISSGNSTIVEYTYNGDDLRVKKVAGKSADGYAPAETNYQYDRQHVILETDSSDNLKARYIRGLNYIARLDADSQLSYMLYNGHGDVVQTVSKYGDIENQYDYDIFGNPVLTVEKGAEAEYYPYSLAIRYAGEFADVETGLYYLRARYYDPGTGRFISEDSYWGEDENPLSLNLYTYSENDPLRFIDPTGHTKMYFMGKEVTDANVQLIDGMGFADLRAMGGVLPNIDLYNYNIIGFDNGVASIEFVNDSTRLDDNVKYSFDLNRVASAGSINTNGNGMNYTYRMENGNKKTQVRVSDLMAVRGYQTAFIDGNIYVYQPGHDPKTNDVINTQQPPNPGNNPGGVPGTNPGSPGNNPGNGNTNNPKTPEVEKPNNLPPPVNYTNWYLGIGSQYNTRDDVRVLQRMLIVGGFTDDEGNMLVDDGDFGEKTKQALIKFQKMMKITIDGLAGSETWRSLGLTMNPYTDTPSRWMDRLYQLFSDDSNWKNAYAIYGREISENGGGTSGSWADNGTVNISLDVNTGTIVVMNGNSTTTMVLPTELYDASRDSGIANSSKSVLAKATLEWYNADTQAEKDAILSGIKAVRQYISEHKVSEWTEKYLADTINNNIGGLVGIFTDAATGLTEVEQLNEQVYYTKSAYIMCSVMNASSNALSMGNKVHYDQLNGGTGEWLPTELQKMYKDTEFNFPRRGQSGADVEYISGTHPSKYELNPMKWPEGFNYGDFKPGTANGYKTFLKDINKGKLPADSVYLPYEPKTGKLKVPKVK